MIYFRPQRNPWAKNSHRRVLNSSERRDIEISAIALDLYLAQRWWIEEIVDVARGWAAGGLGQSDGTKQNECRKIDSKSRLVKASDSWLSRLFHFVCYSRSAKMIGRKDPKNRQSHKSSVRAKVSRKQTCRSQHKFVRITKSTQWTSTHFQRESSFSRDTRYKITTH